MRFWFGRASRSTGADQAPSGQAPRALIVGAYPNDLGPKNALLAMQMPQRLDVNRPSADAPRSASACIALRSMSENHFVIPAPFSGTFRWRHHDRDGWNLDVSGVDVAPSILGLLVMPVPRGDWRHPDRPMFQIGCPYNFVTDEPCWITLTPPFLHPESFQTAGIVLSGRWDLYAWPRPISFAFEWSDPAAPLSIRRGEPLLYARFDATDPRRPIALVECERTEWLQYFNAQYTALASSFGGSRDQIVEAHRLRDRRFGPDRWVQPIRGGRVPQGAEEPAR